ncbi:MAG: RagB/SusD family nutrient uptake outer membrane protein [Chitinophagaceae bacterium]|nr:RagB/SusD family nutrient uptake outer membrane protein [Chitinophagaceae bacterium]
MQTNHKSILFLTLFITSFSSCQKLVEVDAPKNAISDKTVFENDGTAIAVMNGIYSKMNKMENGSTSSVTLYAALSADELALYPGSPDPKIPAYYKNDLNYNNITSGSIWDGAYNNIYVANSVLEGMEGSKGLSPAVKVQLSGEAYFIRALNYFFLVNLYGNVPLALSTNYAENSALERAPKDKVWNRIEIDLKKAKDLLSEKFLDGSLLSESSERVRPSKWTAAAALARTYLYMKKYQEAESASSALIENPLFSLEPLDKVFLKNSGECIWSLQPADNGLASNAEEGRYFILPAEGPGLASGKLYFLSKSFYDLFGNADQRKYHWINSVTVIENGAPAIYYYPYKYKIGIEDVPAMEYSQVFRLAEQYLIRAEARAEQGNFSGAVDDLNQIRNRAGLSDTTLSGKQEILDALMKERRLELFLEYGHRWLDLKRTNRVDDVMITASILKGGSWESYKALFPLSGTELKKSLALKQTEGY